MLYTKHYKNIVISIREDTELCAAIVGCIGKDINI